MGSNDISGIPDDPFLIDPALTDQLIEQGEIKDYSIEENLNELLPIFQTLAIDYSLCKQNGSFLFKGNATSTIKQDVVFNITLTYLYTFILFHFIFIPIIFTLSFNSSSSIISSSVYI